jgi:hypothetical protein
MAFEQAMLQAVGLGSRFSSNSAPTDQLPLSRVMTHPANLVPGIAIFDTLAAGDISRAIVFKDCGSGVGVNRTENESAVVFPPGWRSISGDVGR